MPVAIGLYMVAMFFNMGWSQRDANAKLAVAFFSVARISFNAVAFLPVMFAEKELFFKQVSVCVGVFFIHLFIIYVEYCEYV